MVCPITTDRLTIGQAPCQSKVTVRNKFYRNFLRELFYLRELPVHPAAMRSPDLRAVAAPQPGRAVVAAGVASTSGGLPDGLSVGGF